MGKLKIVGLLLATALRPSPASAEVKVNFIAPEKYYDASLYGYGNNRYDRTIKQIETIFQGLAGRYLAPGDQLTIDVLNVDLAGEYETTTGYPVRLLSDVTWPRFRLRYVLTRASGPPIAGEEVVTDPNYMTFPGFHSGSETMSYEKAMLQRWFKARFARSS